MKSVPVVPYLFVLWQRPKVVGVGSAPTAEPNRDKGKWSRQVGRNECRRGRAKWARMMQVIKVRAAGQARLGI